jgi:hypothetical protein
LGNSAARESSGNSIACTLMNCDIWWISEFNNKSARHPEILKRVF